MPRVAQIIALLLAYMVAPGVAELSENVVHIAIHGDTAHEGGAGHEESGSTDEHGCSGSFHLCICCHVSVVLSQQSPSLPVASEQPAERGSAPQGVRDSGVLGSVFRPPIV